MFDVATPRDILRKLPIGLIEVARAPVRGLVEIGCQRQQCRDGCAQGEPGVRQRRPRAFDIFLRWRDPQRPAGVLDGNRELQSPVIPGLGCIGRYRLLNGSFREELEMVI